MSSTLRTYIQVASLGWQSGFVYRLNFVMWRVRNVIQLIAIYFLWNAVLSRNPDAFGYTSTQLLTYIIGTSLMRAIVMSSRSIDAQSEISSGDLSNYLVRPINYFHYWFSRDVADKLLNILFSIAEITLLFIWLKPPILVQTEPLFLGGFLLAAPLAMLMYFFFSFLVSMTTFWIPESGGWGQRFFIMIILEFFAGGLFPLDILPQPLDTILGKLPFAYFLNTPLQIYLGRLTSGEIIVSLASMAIWILLLRAMAYWVYERGLRVYGAYGR